MTNQIEKLQTESLSSLDRESLEQIIREDVQAIQGAGHRLGECLKIVRDRLFYKPDFSTFESYCEETWGIPKRNADRLIAGAVVRADVESYVNKLIESGEMRDFAQPSLLPVIESHCDALNSVAKELRGEVWLKANGELKPNERLTAKKILDVALKCTTEKAPKTSTLPPLTSPKPTVQTTIEPDDQPDEFETLDEPEGDSNQTTEPAPQFELTESEPEIVPEQTPAPEYSPEIKEMAAAVKRYLTTPKGRVGKVSDQPTPTQLFDFAILNYKHIQGMPSTALNNVHRMIKDGARCVVFTQSLIKSSSLIEACESWGFSLDASFVLVKAEEAKELFQPNHEHILVFSKGTPSQKMMKVRTAAEKVHDYLNGYPGTAWHGDYEFATAILMRAYTTPGDRVLCPTGGTEFIAGALACANTAEYLAKDEESLAYYQEVFGNEA